MFSGGVMRRPIGSRVSAFCLGLAVSAVIATPEVAGAEGKAYTFTRVMYPGSTHTQINGINNAGVAVGVYVDSAGQTHGFSFSAGTYTTIDFPGAVATWLGGIGPTGIILGSHAPTSNGPWHAFTKNGNTFTSFDFPGMETDARTINSAGQIVGVYNQGPGTAAHGFLKLGETLTPIDYPGATQTVLEGINDNGVITGSYGDATGIHGFVSYNLSYQQIDFPGAERTRIMRTNNANEMVGWREQIGVLRPFVVKGYSFRSYDIPGAVVATANGINDLGQVVGGYGSVDCPAGCGYIGTPITAAAAPCDQSLSMTYTGGTLKVNYSIKTSVATTATTSLLVQGTSYQLWSLSLPPVTPMATLSVPISIGPVGNIIALSTISNAAGILCADYSSVNTTP
jgi:uncharacterized membrane protein